MPSYRSGFFGALGQGFFFRAHFRRIKFSALSPRVFWVLSLSLSLWAFFNAAFQSAFFCMLASGGFFSSLFRRGFPSTLLQQLFTCHLCTSFFVRSFTVAFSVVSIAGALLLRRLPLVFWVRPLLEVFLCTLPRSILTWILSRGLFRCARLHGFFPSNVLQGDFNGNFRVSVSRSLFCRALFVRVFVGVDSMRFLERLYLELFQGGFFRAFFRGAPFRSTFLHERFPWALSRGLSPCAFSQLLFACTLSFVCFFTVASSVPFLAGVFTCAFCESVFCALFCLCFSRGFFAVAISTLVFVGLFFCALIRRRDIRGNLRLSLLRPFSCRASFVRSFVGPDSMRFFTDAYPSVL